MVFTTWELSVECTWGTIVLLPKGGGKYLGIGLAEVLCKFIAIIIDQCLMEFIEFHEIMNGFRAHRETGTSTLEAKIRYFWISTRPMARWTGGAPERSWKGAVRSPRYSDS